MRVKVWKYGDGVRAGTILPVYSLALVENPKKLPAGVEGGSRLDAIVSHPRAYGHVLASELYGSSTRKFELMRDAETKDLMMLPEGMGLFAEF